MGMTALPLSFKQGQPKVKRLNERGLWNIAHIERSFPLILRMSLQQMNMCSWIYAAGI